MKRLLVFFCLCLIASSCASKQPSPEKASTVKVQAEGKAESIDSKYHVENGKVWIPVNNAADLIHHRCAWDPERKTALMGFTDPIYELTADVKKAKAGDEEIELNEAPKVLDGMLYIESSSLSQLWKTPITWDGKANTVFVTTSNDQFWGDFLINPYFPMPGTGTTVPETPTAPAAPTAPTAPAPAPAPGPAPTPTAPSKPRPASTAPPAPTPPVTMNATGDAGKLVEFAKTLLGTRYQFAAGPFPATHTFDCSSFVQYVFNHVGINLPRSSQEQASTGKQVDRSELQPADLVFFYTPGRFSNNQKVGHVGIYIGNGQIIHTYGSPGVTITDLNSPNWSKRFLHARREL